MALSTAQWTAFINRSSSSSSSAPVVDSIGGVVMGGDISTLDAKVRELNTDILGAKVSISLSLNWTTFFVTWQSWFAEHGGGTFSIPGLEDDVEIQFLNLQAQYNELLRRFKKEGGTTGATPSAPPSVLPPGVGDALQNVATGFGITIAVVLAWLFFSRKA